MPHPFHPPPRSSSYSYCAQSWRNFIVTVSVAGTGFAICAVSIGRAMWFTRHRLAYRRDKMEAEQMELLGSKDAAAETAPQQELGSKTTARTAAKLAVPSAHDAQHDHSGGGIDEKYERQLQQSVVEFIQDGVKAGRPEATKATVGAWQRQGAAELT